MPRPRNPLERLETVPWNALRTDLALPAVERVLSGAAAEREIDRTLRANRSLSRDERTALVEAIFGVALWRRRLAWHAGSATPSALLDCLVHDLARSTPPERLADRWSLPDWLERHLERELGAEADAFCAAIAVPGPVCLRANRLLATREQLAARLAEDGIATHPASRARNALHVDTEKPNLFRSMAWQEGLFEPQDEGSQLVGALVETQPGDTVLDLCAGAGGKSLQLAAEGALVLAHDIDRGRLDRLRTRAIRACAASRIEIVKAAVPADRVLVDAPCSELGTLRRGPDARWRIEETALETCPPIQAALLETAAANARKRIVYATCTVNRAENEAVAAGFETAHPEFRRAATLTLLPHRDGTDGFFAAAWDRT
ncbi:MAG: RsmB/NOP family class I SAM-dependent RNA methyltransferase [Myxococcales bacterium]|nr:RsmB/NOP family class I SAM-dependent RNA methyltransferase [Myxococcales bacterium]